MASAPKKAPSRSVGGARSRAVAERATAVESVLRHAPDIGMEKAIVKFGNALTKADEKILQSLSADALKGLKETQAAFADVLSPDIRII